MKHFLLLLLLSSAMLCKAQKVDSNKYKLQSPALLVFNVESHYTPEGAKSDIAAKKIQILFSGGFGGMPNFENESDKRFQQRYKVEFYSQGCLRSGVDDQVGYNAEMFKFLDSQYGTVWRKEIRPDAIGLKQ